MIRLFFTTILEGRLFAFCFSQGKLQNRSPLTQKSYLIFNIYDRIFVKQFIFFPDAPDVVQYSEWSQWTSCRNTDTSKRYRSVKGCGRCAPEYEVKGCPGKGNFPHFVQNGTKLFLDQMKMFVFTRYIRW